MADVGFRILKQDDMSDKTVYSRRNPAIDMLRALTMFTMIFVNDFWKVHDVPHWLEHAVYGEDFMGLADIVFPCFLFAVGMSIPYAIERRYAKGFSAESTLGHILSRTFALLVMGAFITNSEFRLSPEAPYPIGVYWFLMAIGFIGVWNQYPKPASGTQKNLFRAFKIIGVLVLLYLAFTFRNPQEGVFGAYWGILGSIGWTYLVCAVIYFFSRDRLKYLLPIWGVFILICLLGTPLRESFGGEAILTFPERNFYQGMLGILHIGNGALPAFTMGGIILSILSARYADKGDGWKLRNGLTAAVLLLLAGIGGASFLDCSQDRRHSSLGVLCNCHFRGTLYGAWLLGQSSGHGLVQSDTPCRNGYADYLSGALCLLWIRRCDRCYPAGLVYAWIHGTGQLPLLCLCGNRRYLGDGKTAR